MSLVSNTAVSSMKMISKFLQVYACFKRKLFIDVSEASDVFSRDYRDCRSEIRSVIEWLTHENSFYVSPSLEDSSGINFHHRTFSREGAPSPRLRTAAPDHLYTFAGESGRHCALPALSMAAARVDVNCDVNFRPLHMN